MSPETHNSIEHLDFSNEAACEHGDHSGDPTAVAWVDSHGCWQGFSCAKCLQIFAEHFGLIMSQIGTLICSQCDRRFTAHDQFRTVTML